MTRDELDAIEARLETGIENLRAAKSLEHAGLLVGVWGSIGIYDCAKLLAEVRRLRSAMGLDGDVMDTT